MFIHVTPKKVNDVKELTISATFEHNGVAYEERYKRKHHFINAIKRKKDKFINAVDTGSMKVVYPETLREYMVCR